MHRQIAGTLTGPVTKWIVLALTVVVTGLMAYLGGGMGDVKDNEQSSWVPASAESTKVADQVSGEVNPNDIPTLVVYERESGLTDADLAAMDEDAKEIADLDGVTADGVLSPNAAAALADQGAQVPTLVSKDGKVAYLYFTFNFGSSGWEKVPAQADNIRDIAKIDGGNVYVSGFGGLASDFSESFEESQSVLFVITFLVVILILLLSYRSPVLWLLPILSAVVSIMTTTGVVYCWPSTPTSRSTTRRSTSWTSW